MLGSGGRTEGGEGTGRKLTTKSTKKSTKSTESHINFLFVILCFSGNRFWFTQRSQRCVSRRDAKSAKSGKEGMQDGREPRGRTGGMQDGRDQENLCDLCDYGFSDLCVLRGRKFQVNHREHEERHREHRVAVDFFCDFVF
jgi:hypothetical protein